MAESRPPAAIEDRRLKLAGLALIGAAQPGFLWLAARTSEPRWWNGGAVSLAADAGVFILCANLATLGLLVLISGFGRRELWRDPRARRAALVKLLGANVLLPVLVFSLLQDDQAGAALLENDGIAAILALAAYALIALGAGTLRRGWRHEAASAEEAMAADPRPPVIYLRSFADDGRMLLASAGRWSPSRVGAHFVATSAEQELAFVLERIGPVIAIGKPGEPLPELGAARLYVDHAHWQEKVISLLRQAAVVAIRIGASAGVRWEIERTLESVPRSRILFILLGDDDAAAQAARELGQLLGAAIHLPAPAGGWRRGLAAILGDPRRRLGALVCFDPGGAPIVEPVRRLPRHAIDFALMCAARPSAGPLRDALRRVFAQWRRPWIEVKSRGVAVVLALAFGGFGAHWFYLGRRRAAFAYLLGFITLVPFVLAWIDALRWLLMDKAGFEARVLQEAVS